MNTLKIAFNVIVGTLCIILVAMTALTLIGKVPLDTYKGILEVLGIPTLFGMIVQSFIHSNQNGGSNASNLISSNTIGSTSTSTSSDSTSTKS